MVIVLILFVFGIVLSHFLYDEVELSTVIQVLGSLFGITVGSFLTGRHAFHTYKKQVEQQKKEKQNENDTKQEKYNIFLSIHLNIILNDAKSIRFFMRQQLTQNIYNVDPIKEINKSLSNIKQVINQLFNIDPSYISKDNYILLGKIYNKTYDIENSFNGYLATEEEESYILSQEVIKKSKELLVILEK